MPRWLSALLWAAISLTGAGAFAYIGLQRGETINAAWLLVGLRQRGSYQPRPGWWKFSLQVVAASALLAVFLIWAASALPWTRFEGEKLERIGYLALVLIASAAIYFAALWATGMQLRKLRHPSVKSA